MRRYCLLACLCFLSLPNAHASDADALALLLEEHWQRSQAEQLFFRRDPDSFRMGASLPDLSEAGRERRRRYNDEVLERLAQIDEGNLDPAGRVSYRVFRYERRAERDSYGQADHLFPMTNRVNWQSYFVNAPGNMSFLDAGDYRDYLSALADYPRYNREQLALLREAVALGYTQHCESMRGVDSALQADLVQEPRDSALYLPFANMPSTIPAQERARIEAQGRKLLAEAVLPAFAELLQFYREQYYPACRAQPGVNTLEGGGDYYAYLVNYFTTMDISPRQVHELGLSEVARIRGEMQQAMQAAAFDGSFEEFLAFLRSDPRFYTDDPEDLLEKASRIAKRMDGQMPRLFATLPRNTYDIKPVPAAFAEGTTGAYYVPAPGDGRTPGTYFVNTSLLPSRPLYTLEALTLHEAVPGHHLQNAIAQEAQMPTFRRFLNHSAFSEGWALYSERLGLEAGFYSDPYSNFGRLTYEMWRACRLVIDTGLHAFGWNRQQAIDYMLANTALSEHEATAEIDRYITWPGQALSYKLGELRIRALRAQAEQALGEGFDLRLFHDEVLRHGSLPIEVLESLIEDWIDAQRAAAG